MLFFAPDRITFACSPHCFSASATFARYFRPIHRRVVLLETFEAWKAHRAHMERFSVEACLKRAGEAMTLNGSQVITVMAVHTFLVSLPWGRPKVAGFRKEGNRAIGKSKSRRHFKIICMVDDVATAKPLFRTLPFCARPRRATAHAVAVIGRSDLGPTSGGKA